jgi:serine/threonine protein kinase
MTQATPCPDARRLEQFALGALSEPEIEALAQHLSGCERCLETLQNVQAEDTLSEAMRSSAGDRPAVPQLDQLKERLRALRRPISAGLEATASGSAESDPAVRPAPEHTEELYSFLTPAQAPGELGRLGDFRVLKILGTGGMGVVFLAEDLRLKRPVALKVMKPELSRRPDFSARFRREAQAAAAVKHDHIATIHQVGEDRGIPFLTMELLEGETLATRLDRAGRLPIPEVLRIGQEMARALSAAHAKGLIHRDIKPANIWLEGEPAAAATGGRVKILDFGLAKLERPDIQATQSGRIVGTPAYMAPEQARGETVDSRADLFSLGCVLYRAATGQLAFKGTEPMSVLWSLANERPQSARIVNPQVPAVLSDLIDRLLAKRPADRPGSAQEVADALAAIAQTRPIARRPVPGRRVAIGLALAAAAAVVALTIVIIRDRHGREVARIEVPEGGTVEIKGDGKNENPAAAPMGDADRRAAEWVLSIGGDVGITGAGQRIHAARDLPAGSFKLLAVQLNGNHKVSDSGLAHLEKLRSLTSLWLQGSPLRDNWLVHLGSLTSLDTLILHTTGVSDVGLQNVSGLINLEGLTFATTRSPMQGWSTSKG